MKKLLNWFKNEESGQGMVEYGLIIAAIAIAVIAVIFLLGNQVQNLFNNVTSRLASSTPSAS